ncbi:MAG: hypothetical protein KBA66_06980 [Leptospiraceae bacterium]|nr:hypothetical protein [Leptospiraceae bacterium]
MKIYKFLIPFLFLVSSSIFAQAKPDKSRLAVLDLEPGAGVSVKESEYISDILRTELVKTKMFTVIDRSSVKKILEEQAFQQKGCVDTKCTVKIGQLLAANKILEGKVLYRNSKYIVTVNIVDVESGKLDFAEQLTLSSVEEFESKNEIFVRKISANISGVEEGSVVIRKPRAPYVWRSALIPGWGQFHKGDEDKAAIIGSFGILFLGNAISSYQRFQNAQADYNSALGLPYFMGEYALPYNFLTITPKREAVIEAQNTANLSLGLLAAFWLLNIGDAYYFEPEAKKLSFRFDLTKDRSYALDKSQGQNYNYFIIQVKYQF